MPAGVRLILTLDPDAAWLRDLAAGFGLTLRQTFARVRPAAAGDFHRLRRELGPPVRGLAARTAAIRRATSNPAVVEGAEAIGRAAAAIEARTHAGR